MATVATNHVEEDPQSHESDHVPESASTFTAVNGSASPGPPVKPKPDQEHHKEAPEVKSNRSILPNNHQEAAKTPVIRSRPDVSQPERRPSQAPIRASTPTPVLAPAIAPTPSQPADRTYSHPSQYPGASDEAKPQHETSHSRNSSNQHPQDPSLTSQKRKRSYGEEHENTGNSVYQTNGQSPSPGGQRMNGMENGHSRDGAGYSPRQTYPAPHDSYPLPPQEPYHHAPQHAYPLPPHQRPSPPEIYPRPDRHELVRNDYDQPVDPSIAPARQQPYYSEAHMAEVLQRENRGGYDSMPPGRDQYVTPEDDDDPHGQYGDYGSRSQSAMEMDRKRRKRVFSNRTKTGCMTCRRRKKKCDEQHPECNNCLRGGFVCEGYTMRNTWQKPTNAKAPIPLQSKNGYPSHPGVPRRGPYPPGVMPRYQDDGPEYPGPPSQAMQHRPSFGGEGDRGKPISIEDDRDQVYGRSNTPNGQKPVSAWVKHQRNPYPSNPPQASKYQEGEHRGSIYEIPPDGQESNPMHPPPSVNRTGSAQSQNYPVQSHPPPHNNTPPNHNNAQAAAQAALTHGASIRPSPSRRNDHYTEREKMLKGLYYYPLTPALTADRENCIAAIWRFNNATNPSHGASPEERSRLFRQILNLRPTPEPVLSNGEAPPANFPLPYGSVGERVVVEAPFHCDYGYNIIVGDDVLIGADCRISDTCSVSIGARCIFSPNVKLVCSTYPIDPRRRLGSNGPALGRNIVIEEDCWIGSNVTILAGVKVGKSSTVGAGSLLHQDVPRFTVVAGNPAKVSRGIYDGSADGQ